MPVKRSGAGHLMIVHELDLLQGLVNGHCTPSDTVGAAAKPLEGQVALDDPLTRVQNVFDQHNVAIVVKDGDVVGVISKIDVVEFLAARQ